MKYSKYDNYEKLPLVEVNETCYSGYKSIANQLLKHSEGKQRFVVVVDCYTGADVQQIQQNLCNEIKFDKVILSDKCAKSSAQLDQLLEPFLTDDRVFGYMCHKKLDFLFDWDKVLEHRHELEQIEKGNVLVIGVGAGYIAKQCDVHVFADMARWEIQLRYRNGMPNFNANNSNAPILSKYKRGYFVEWRMCDKYKSDNWENFHYFMDVNNTSKPKMISSDSFFRCIDTITKRPFRLTPYFDPGVWGGQWMKEVCKLDKSQKNYAWSFDGVPEENSVNFLLNGEIYEMPAINAVLYSPRQLLGDKVHARFGTEFPIRFDFLDTIEGQNLSLQVHPLTEYIQQNFGMNYTQDESYYILDTNGDDTYVYLGLKTGTDKQSLYNDLCLAQQGKQLFPDDKYINKIKVKKHDHVLMPAGTVHCSGANTMVLEVSATPYIFTFKLWDWARVGLDGLPRPTHIEHGINNIQFDRNTQWVNDNLVNQQQTLVSDSHGTVERTGLHKREFIETRRYTTANNISVDRLDSVCMCNLVDGREAIVRSLEGKFDDFTVHYAETFIVPYDAGEFEIVSPDKSTVMVLVANVR